MSAAVCLECKQAVDANAKFCAGCGAPQGAEAQTNAQANKPASSRKNLVIIGGVVAAAALVGVFLFAGSKSSTTTNSTNNADANTASASSSPAPSQDQNNRVDIARYAEYSQYLANLSQLMLKDDDILISKLDGNRGNRDINSNIAIVEGYAKAIQSLAKDIDEAPIPALGNKDALQAAINAKQNLKDFELCQEEMVKLLFAEIHGQITKEKLIAAAKEISGRKTTSLDTFKLMQLAGYNYYGIQPQNVDSATVAPKLDGRQ